VVITASKDKSGDKYKYGGHEAGGINPGFYYLIFLGLGQLLSGIPKDQKDRHQNSEVNIDGMKQKEAELTGELNKIASRMSELNSQRTEIESKRINLSSRVVELNSEVSKARDRISLNKGFYFLDHFF